MGKKWQQRYVKKSNIPSHVDGYRDPVDIAEQFQQAFTSSNFDSYADKTSVFELKERLSKMDKRELTKKVFEVVT